MIDKDKIKLETSVHRQATTVTTNTIKITGKGLLTLLRAADIAAIPDNATVEFVVPSGADWSGMDVDIDNEHPIIVSWKVMEPS